MMVQYEVMEVDMERKKIKLKEVTEKTSLPNEVQFSVDMSDLEREKFIEAELKKLDDFLDKKQQQIKDGTFVPFDPDTLDPESRAVYERMTTHF